LPLLKAVGPRADGSAVGRVRIEIPLLKNMLGHDAHSPRGEARRKHFAIDDPDGVGVRCGDGGDVLKITGIRGMDFGIAYLVVRKENIVGSKRHTVMPADSFS